MKDKEFQELPIGKVLIYDAGKLQQIEVKFDKNKTFTVEDDVLKEYSFGNGDAGEIVDYIDEYDVGYLKELRVAPKWVQKLYEVLK